jgi:glycosyltransferase involved in cell wall biosynthesis
MPYISVVIPVYKAEDCVEELCIRLRKSLSHISEDFEIILVEDCSEDNSWEIIRKIAQLEPRVKGIKFSRNFGQHYGITAGLDYCDGDWVVVMDCDLQDRPEEIIPLYKKAKEGYEIVVARRSDRQDFVIKKLSSWLFYKVFSYLTDVCYDYRIGNFRIVSRKVVNNFRLVRERLRFFGGIIELIGYKVSYVQVQHDRRFSGKSTYTYRKLFVLAGETIIAYSDKPLRIAIKLGFTMAAIAFAFGTYIIYRSVLYGALVSGWSSVMVSMYFLGGITIGFLGVLGIYIGKTFDETKKRPLYFVDEKTFDNK